MQPDEVRYGQRVRVNVWGIGDHGQVGTVKKVRGTRCAVRLDWDQRLQHVVWFYATDLDPVEEERDEALTRETQSTAAHDGRGDHRCADRRLS